MSAISARYDMTKFGLVITWVGKGSEPTGSKVLADLHGSNQFDQYTYSCGTLRNSSPCHGFSEDTPDTPEGFVRAMLRHGDALWAVSYLDAMLDYGYTIEN